MFDQRAQALERRHRARVDLGRYREAAREAQWARDQVAYLQSKAERTSKPMNPNRVQVQATNDGPEYLLCRIADMQLDTERLERRAERVGRAIKERIRRVSDGLYRSILSGYWVQGLTLAQIAHVEGFSLSHVKRLHGEALDEYASYLKVDTR